MKLLFIGLVLAAASYFVIQTPQGKAVVLRAAAVGQGLANNIVGNLTR